MLRERDIEALEKACEAAIESHGEASDSYCVTKAYRQSNGWWITTVLKDPVPLSAGIGGPIFIDDKFQARGWSSLPVKVMLMEGEDHVEPDGEYIDVPEKYAKH